MYVLCYLLSKGLVGSLMGRPDRVTGEAGRVGLLGSAGEKMEYRVTY